MHLTIRQGTFEVASLLLRTWVMPGRLSWVRTWCLVLKCVSSVCWSVGLLVRRIGWISPTVMARRQMLLVCWVWQIRFTLLVVSGLSSLQSLSWLLMLGMFG